MPGEGPKPCARRYQQLEPGRVLVAVRPDPEAEHPVRYQDPPWPGGEARVHCENDRQARAVALAAARAGLDVRRA
jgi:hypothetical protein